MEERKLNYKEKVYELGLTTNEALKIMLNNPGEYSDSMIFKAIVKKYDELRLDIDNETKRAK